MAPTISPDCATIGASSEPVQRDLSVTKLGAGKKMRHIFVVDDSATSRMMIEHAIHALEIPDLDVVTFGDAKSALKKIIVDRPEAVISDITMPGASGLQLVAAMRSSGIDTPIALCTASANASTQKEAVDVGADGFLEKPISLEILGQFLADHAGLGQAIEISPLFDDDAQMAGWVRDGFTAIGTQYSTLSLEALEELSFSGKSTATIGTSIQLMHRGDLRKISLTTDWQPAKTLAQHLLGKKPNDALPRSLVGDALGELLNIALANVLKRLDELMDQKDLTGEKVTLSPPTMLERLDAERAQDGGHCLGQRFSGVGIDFTIFFCVSGRSRL